MFYTVMCVVLIINYCITNNPTLVVAAGLFGIAGAIVATKKRTVSLSYDEQSEKEN